MAEKEEFSFLKYHFIFLTFLEAFSERQETEGNGRKRIRRSQTGKSSIFYFLTSVILSSFFYSLVI